MWPATGCVTHSDLLHCCMGCSQYRVPTQDAAESQSSWRHQVQLTRGCLLPPRAPAGHAVLWWHRTSKAAGVSSAWEQKMPAVKLRTNILAFGMQTAVWGVSCTVLFLVLLWGRCWLKRYPPEGKKRVVRRAMRASALIDACEIVCFQCSSISFVPTLCCAFLIKFFLIMYFPQPVFGCCHS